MSAHARLRVAFWFAALATVGALVVGASPAQAGGSDQLPPAEVDWQAVASFGAISIVVGICIYLSTRRAGRSR